MSINSCWWNVSSSALERVLFSFPAWNGICRDFLKVEIQKNLQIKAKIFNFGNYIVFNSFEIKLSLNSLTIFHCPIEIINT